MLYVKIDSSRPVIFLDIDGVLNHRQWYQERQKLPKMDKECEEFSPTSVSLLNRLCQETNAQIVVSSSWRFNPDLQDIFAHVGIETPITTITPHFEGKCRGEEIQFVIDRDNIKNYIIIDDAADEILDTQKDRLILTDAYGAGLDDITTEKAIKLLKQE